MPDTIEFVGRTRENNGIKGYTTINSMLPNEANTISISQVGTITAQIRKNRWYASQNIFILKPKDSRNLSLGILTAINKVLAGTYSDGYANYPTLEKLDTLSISLPEKSKGVIDFEFIENFVRELERARLRELEAYLAATGLNNYELTATDRATLANFKNIKWGHYSLGKLFDIQNTLSFNTDRLTNGEEYDYITRTSFNQGILQATGFVNQENINPAGTWSLGLLQMDFFYRNRPWYAGQFVRKIVPKIKISERSKLFFQTILNMQKSVLLQVLVRNVDETFRKTEVQLPQTEEGEIDFEYIEQLVAAVQKIVIADVAKYTARNLEATQQVIEAQDEPQVEQTITPLITEPKESEKYISLLPVYSLRAACGYFGDGEEVEELGWMQVEGMGRLNKDMFVVQAVGQSMEPRIHNGDYCVFEKYSGGSRQGKIVLAQHRGYFDEDNAGAYSIKEYSSEKSYNDDGSWQHESITLRPFNPAYEPIRIDAEDAESFAIIGEFVGVVTL